ncbi:hypothetical protein [Paenibacillus jilunlii]|uniref:Phage-related minor tail protein n=1 Tax=Paenibacillus jilunlii TaxID=682956 RepID=A0A1G9W5V9_9BACL|nr:hypothetical protein [Paenibacillus jilunlii]KWX76027.1 hypothetical protein AML91_10865 [Paenibacillus jilunlii]SDM79637.1 hypothetical protein SAMN05216191_118109 [Paenibacillus jilunlii]
MRIDVSKAVMLPVKSLAIWKVINKQSLRIGVKLDLANRSIKGMQAVLTRSSDELNRSLDKVNQSLLDINDTLLEGFKRLPPQILVSRDIVVGQSQQAGQSQQLGVRMLNASPTVQAAKKEEEKAKKVEWWKGFEKKAKKDEKEEEKKPEVKVEPVPTPKINLKKEPPVPPAPPTPPQPDSKILNFLKTADWVTPFNKIKSFGEKAVKAAVKPGDIADWNKLNKNVDTAMGKIGEKALGALRPVMDTLSQALTSGQLAPTIDALANGFLVIANVIGMIVDGLLWLVGVVQENWDIIEPILIAIAVVYLAAMIVQVYLLAAAWLAANWPILIVIAVIAALILIFQNLGISAGQVVGAIAGAFSWLMAVFQNIWIGLQNGFYVVWDGIVNGFNTAILFVKQLLYGLGMGTLDVLYNMAVGVESFADGFVKVMVEAIRWVVDKFNGMAEALSKIPFFDKMGIGTIKLDLDGLKVPHAASELVDKYRKEFKTLEPPEDITKQETKHKEYVDTKDAFNSSYTQAKEWTDNKVESISSAFSDKGRDAKKLTKPPASGQQIQNTAGLFANQGGNLNNVNRVNEVGTINDTVDISSEDLEMMRELAEIQAIQNFVELTPTVQVTTGNINNAGDIDTIINKIGQKLNEEFVSTAQGVYT